jgi:hypothetical protein
VSKRPKSREETPNEGSGSMTLPQCNNLALRRTKRKGY